MFTSYSTEFSLMVPVIRLDGGIGAHCYKWPTDLNYLLREKLHNDGRCKPGSQPNIYCQINLLETGFRSNLSRTHTACRITDINYKQRLYVQTKLSTLIRTNGGVGADGCSRGWRFDCF